MALTLNMVVTGLLDRLNAAADEFWLTANFLLYTKDFLRRADVREACWLQKQDTGLLMVLNQNEYTLPADFWRLEEVFWTVSGRDQRLDEGGLGDRHTAPRWLLRGGKLWLEPAPSLNQAGSTIKLYYVRAPTEPANASATLDMPDELGEALQAYLMGRAMQKGGPQMAKDAGQTLGEAETRIGKAIGARAQRSRGFQQQARW